jgi:ADP-ribose pyrophosphatase YjhB (NUDIX family)
MAARQFADADSWYASLPGVVMSAGALITDPAGAVLLVKPNYRNSWSLPGGICEHGEPPHLACRREVAEELGLELPIGRLLVISWAQPRGPAARPVTRFVFDGGTLADGAGIVLQAEELDEFAFRDPGELASYLPSDGLPRVRAAIAARAAGSTSYQAAPGT